MKLYLPFLFSVSLTAGCSEGVNSDRADAAVTPGQGEAAEVNTAQPGPPMAGTPRSLTGDKPLTSPNPHARLTPEQHIGVALQHAGEGRIEQAVDILNRAIHETPDHAGLLGARGGLMLSQDKTVDALKDLERAVSLAPQSALLLVNRSQAYRKFNRLDEAMADLDRAIELSPKLIPARFNRGVLYYGRTEYDKALADFDLCISLDENTPGPYFNRAITKDAMGDSEGAKQDLNQFIALTDNESWKQAARDTLRVIEKRDTEAAKPGGQ